MVVLLDKGRDLLDAHERNNWAPVGALIAVVHIIVPTSRRQASVRGCSVEAVPAGHKLKILSDNGGAYIAADTRALARSLGLQPVNTPVCSPQSNSMAESFVNTFKRNYVARMDRYDAQTVLAQLPTDLEHFNKAHPHSSLKCGHLRSSDGSRPTKRVPNLQWTGRFVATRTRPEIRANITRA